MPFFKRNPRRRRVKRLRRLRKLKRRVKGLEIQLGMYDPTPRPGSWCSDSDSRCKQCGWPVSKDELVKDKFCSQKCLNEYFARKVEADVMNKQLSSSPPLPGHRRRKSKSVIPQLAVGLVGMIALSFLARKL